MNRIPSITLGLCALTCGLMLLPPALREALYFNHGELVGGNALGLISGHWIHADSEHLIWNVSALGVLAGMIETRSRRLLSWSLLTGMASVDLLLVSPFSDLARYCGLSGLLNTLLGVALFLEWRGTRSLIVVVVAIFCLAKIALELDSGQSLFTHISWPPYALAHLAGALGTPAALLTGSRGRAPQEEQDRGRYAWAYGRKRVRSQPQRRRTGTGTWISCGPSPSASSSSATG